MRVFIPGNPAPQGSKKWLGGKTIIDSCKRLPSWRADVRAGLLDGHGQPLIRLGGSPAKVDLEFIMPRPKSLGKKTGVPMVRKPDDEKLSRAVSDAITSAGVWNDDSQCVERTIRKRYAKPDETPGVVIDINHSDYT